MAPTTHASPETVRNAYQAGVDWAKSLKPGSTFKGALPEAKARYDSAPYDARLLRALFVNGALDVLERKVICTDLDGKITRTE